MTDIWLRPPPVQQSLSTHQTLTNSQTDRWVAPVLKPLHTDWNLKMSQWKALQSYIGLKHGVC
jgi:hypothetical protein